MGKGDFKHNMFFKKDNEEADKYCTHTHTKKEQGRNTGVQIIEEETGKLPEK